MPKNNNKILIDLRKALESNSIDMAKVLKLSTELSKNDQDNVRFSVDAGLINRLGLELVARHETAVSELVKNAYDADASYANITFSNTNKKSGVITIEDDGVGMTREELIDGFMRLSSSEKINNPISPTYNRKRAGKKGIGRFATQRLGKKLTIITQTKDADIALKVKIDWNQFKVGEELILISNEIEIVPKLKKTGTQLIIEQVRDRWTQAQIERVYRYASEVIQPFPLSKLVKGNNKDPGFKVICSMSNNNNEQVIVIDEQKMIFESAAAMVTATVNKKGIIHSKIESKKLNIKETLILNEEMPYKKLRGVSLQAHYFIYTPEFIPKHMGFIQEKAKTQGGIRLYRNNFRVLPYGEPSDDWLGLDASVRRRVILPAHANNSWFGFIEVYEEQEELFEELSSREGLLENDALNELTDFGYKVLINVASRVAVARNKKQTAGQKDWDKGPSVQEAVEEVKTTIKRIQSDDKAHDKINKPEIENAIELLEVAVNKDKKHQIELLEEIKLLRVLAALGLTIGEFVHEIKNYQEPLLLDAILLKTEKNLDQIRVISKRIYNSIIGIKAYSSYFDKAVSENVNRELKPIELRTVINEFVGTVKPDFIRRGYEELKPSFDGYNLYTCPMHNSEWASILFNLYTNARKAISRAKVTGRLHITAGKTDDVVYMEFSDNGDGINKDKRDHIFDAFYTTSMPVGKIVSNQEEITGTGLGLKIVKDIVIAYNGSIYVKKPIEGYSTTFRVEFPLEKEGYKYDL